MRRVEFKVPDGKLLAAEMEVGDGRIVRVKITGDFFMHPEAAIEALEEALTNLSSDAASIEDAVKEFFRDRTVDLLGASPTDFIHVLKMSLSASAS